MNQLPQRKIIRLKDYDYSQGGYYFVTICSKDRLNIFGKIVGVDDSVHPPMMQPNDIGNKIFSCWEKINDVYVHVQTDAFCLMPNHIHGIIIISEPDDQDTEPGGPGRPPLQKIIQGFKSVATRLCFPYGYSTIFQRGYYEHIIRNQHELEEVREYILNNVAKWQLDKYYT